MQGLLEMFGTDGSGTPQDWHSISHCRACGLGGTALWHSWKLYQDCLVPETTASAQPLVLECVWSGRRGYWRDVRNVKQEVQQWLKAHPLEAPHLLPSQSQLRRTGHSSLAVAVTKHGGYKKLFSE